MTVSVTDRLVHVHVAVTDFYVKSTGRIRANPRLEMNRGSTAAKIGKRYQVASLAFLALGQNNLHPVIPPSEA